MIKQLDLSVSKDALILKLQDGQNRENLVVLMELWSRMDGAGQFAENMSPQEYLQRLGGLRGVDFAGMLGQLGLTPQEITDLRTNMPSLFTVGDNHFGNELTLINEPAFDLLAVDNADAYNLFVDLAMLDELAHILTVDRNGRLVVDRTQVTPLNARVYNLIAHDLMNDRDVLNALVEQIMAQNPGQYNDIGALPDSYFLTERQATKELAPTLKKLESIENQEAIKAWLDAGLTPEEAMLAVQKQERKVWRDLIKGSSTGFLRLTRGVIMMLALSTIASTIGQPAVIVMGIFAAINLLRGAGGMAVDAVMLIPAFAKWIGAELKGDKEEADRFKEDIKQRTDRLLMFAIGTGTGVVTSLVFGPAAGAFVPLLSIPGKVAAEAIVTVQEKGMLNQIEEKIKANLATPEEIEKVKKCVRQNRQAGIDAYFLGLNVGAIFTARAMESQGKEGLLKEWLDKNPKVSAEKDVTEGGPKGEEIVEDGGPKTEPGEGIQRASYW